MTSLFRKALAVLCLVGVFGANAQNQPANESQPVDRIVAVVNDEVITLHELNARLDFAVAQLQKQGTPLPPRGELERQMLDRLIMDKVQLQHARDSGMRIDDSQLEQALQRIAANNKMSLTKFRDALQKDGISFVKFREDIREEMTIARVREHVSLHMQAQKSERIPVEKGGKKILIGIDKIRFVMARDDYAYLQTDTDRYGRVVADCFVGRESLNNWMVREGWAVAYRQYSIAYIAAEDDARTGQRGIWQGRFDMPWDWRAERRSGQNVAPTMQRLYEFAGQNWSCGPRRTCSQIGSCDEARWYLQNCPWGGKLDRDNDGIPCESIC